MDNSPVDFIHPYTFVSVAHNNFEEAHGIKEGDIVFVASLKAYPMSEEDPYTQRIFLLVQKMEGDMIDDANGFFLFDPTSVKNIDKAENDRLRVINLSYNEDIDVTAPN